MSGDRKFSHIGLVNADPSKVSFGAMSVLNSLQDYDPSTQVMIVAFLYHRMATLTEHPGNELFVIAGNMFLRASNIVEHSDEFKALDEYIKGELAGELL